MDELIVKLRKIEGVKAVRKFSGSLRVELFSRPIPGSENVEISGDLRKISQQLRKVFEEARDSGAINGWNWTVKPEKEYKDSSPVEGVSDRSSKGYDRGFYRISYQPPE